MSDHRRQVIELLRAAGRGDSGELPHVHRDRYVEHNLSIGPGLEGLRHFFLSRPRGTSPFRLTRLFEDGEFVFAHGESDLFGPRVCFEVFRFENDQIVEHWDNLQAPPHKPNPSGHTMLDGPTAIADLDRTAENKALLTGYMQDLVQGRREKLSSYFDGDHYVQHNPGVADGLSGLAAGLTRLSQEGKAVHYDRVHRVLGEGNFVLVIAEGSLGTQPTAYYDLYRLQRGKIAEHWDTLEAIPPRAEWKNPNGKF